MAAYIMQPFLFEICIFKINKFDNSIVNIVANLQNRYVLCIKHSLVL